jgi:two-component system sensor histidine kinase KdpD
MLRVAPRAVNCGTAGALDVARARWEDDAVMVDGEPDAARRPSPEALLEAAAREQRSRLKVFVGAAPGVGKTYAMLQAARDRKREGVDVAVGVVETHGRAETQALLEGLEVIPRRTVEYRGQRLEEMDIDAILARQPALVLVDELAHTNAPGSRHAKRFQDVEELLEAGIDVYTTVNIQHLESLNDVVAQITGVRVRETIPDGVLDRADEVKLIDLSPEELIQRLRDGKVYVPQQAERALRNYFHPGNLTALRELALRETAEHVDEQMQAFMRTHAVEGVWPVAERVMVAIGGGPLSERLVRAARRIAERRDAPWLAVFVETARFRQQPDAERERIAKILRLAEQLGGEAVAIPGEDVAEELVRYAERRNVTELVLGRSPGAGRWWWPWARPTADRVLARSGSIDVRVVSGTRAVSPARGRWTGIRTSGAAAYALAAGLVALAAGVASALMAAAPLDDPAMLFLTAVLFSALAGGLGPSIFASLLGLLVYDFFFVDPRLTLTVTKPQDILSLVVFLVVAVLTSELTSRVRNQADAARRREARTAALYAFGREIAAAARVEDLVRVVVEHVGHLFGTAVALLLPRAGRLVLRAAHPPGIELSEAERGTATWAWEHDQQAGRGTDTLPGGEWLHVPLGTARGAVGVLALRPTTAGALPPDQRQLLDALARQTAVGIERTRVDLVESVIESIEDGLVVLDPQGVVVHVNEVACAILGFERDEAVGRRFAELGTTHPHYLRLRAAVGEFLAHPEREGVAVEMAIFLRGRDHFYVLRPTPFRALDGSVAGLILVLQDVTYVRDQEARREQLMATLSHELRTPLTSLRMAVELLRREPGGDGDLLGAAHEDVLRLEDVAQRLLDVSRSRAMTIPLERKQVDVGTLVTRVTKLFELQARERGVSVATAVPADALALAGDATKLGWALSNLVANALRYTPRGGRVQVEATAGDGTVRISVTDTGPGIPPEQRERIFERFVQGTETAEAGAAGLGLAIVRDIVQAHGGRIFLDTEVGRGSRFTLELPRA